MFKTLIKNPYFKEVIGFLKNKRLADNSYLVGGSVRDILLKRALIDLDFAIKGDSIKLARELAKKIKGSFVLLDEEFSIGRVVKDSVTIDFAELRGGSIENDLSERDFTINAMAITLSLDKIIDPFNGAIDLKNKLIRMVNEENLKADPLRILRAYRFYATLGFSIDETTHEALRKNAPLLKFVARERIKEELWKILSVSESSRTVELIIEDKLFTAIFPLSSFTSLKTDLDALRILERLLEDPKKVFNYWRGLLSINILCSLKFACLFGFQSPSLIMKLKPSKKESRFIEKLKEAGEKIRKIENLIDKVRFIKNYENILYPALLYSISKDPMGVARAWFYQDLERFHKKVYLKNKRKLPLINGEELIKLGFEPSPLIGEILERIEMLVLMNKISKKEEALKEIEKFKLK